MALTGVKGVFILDADAAPGFAPSTVGAIANVAGTQIMYFHQAGTTWDRIDIGALSSADGNTHVIVRAANTTGILPTLVEVPAAGLDNGDTASAYLPNGTIEVYAYNGTVWALAYTTTAQTLSNALVTLSGVASGAVDLGTFTGTTITDNGTVKAAMQELETRLELAPSTYTDTNSVNLTFVPATGVLTADVVIDPTQDNEDTITVSATGVRVTKQTLTAYVSVAAAVAAVAVGESYILLEANLDGIPSDGVSGPVLRRIS